MRSLILRTASFLLLCLLCAFLFVGCQAKQVGDKPGDEMNSAMTPQQKALIAEHKKRGEQ